ncbi:MAG: hypothetical protein DRP74_06035, partial [Candidatus Omnitrophota bacterium]
PLQSQLKNKLSQQPKVSGISQRSSKEDIDKLEDEYKSKIKSLDGLLSSRIYLTEILDTIPCIIPINMRLVSMDLVNKEGGVSLQLEGIVAIGERSKEMLAVNDFLVALKNQGVFSKIFQDISIVSINQNEGEKGVFTSFIILCQNQENLALQRRRR